MACATAHKLQPAYCPRRGHDPESVATPPRGDSKIGGGAGSRRNVGKPLAAARQRTGPLGRARRRWPGGAELAATRLGARIGCNECWRLNITYATLLVNLNPSQSNSRTRAVTRRLAKNLIRSLSALQVVMRHKACIPMASLVATCTRPNARPPNACCARPMKNSWAFFRFLHKTPAGGRLAGLGRSANL